MMKHLIPVVVSLMVGAVIWALLSFKREVVAERQAHAELEQALLVVDDKLLACEAELSRSKSAHEAAGTYEAASADEMIAKLRKMPAKVDCLLAQSAWFGKVEGEANIPDGLLRRSIKEMDTSVLERLNKTQRQHILNRLSDGTLPTCETEFAEP